MTIPDMVTVNGTVNLILEDGCNLTSEQNIYMPAAPRDSTTTLNIYAQSEGDSMGSLTAHGAPSSYENEFYAAIGNSAPPAGMGNGHGLYDSSLYVYGGNVTANSPDYAARSDEQFGILLDKIEIHGGIVNAYGGHYGLSSQTDASVNFSQLIIDNGILNASGGIYGISSIALHLNGGTVNATGSTSAVYATTSSVPSGIDVTNGTLNATGGTYGI